MSLSALSRLVQPDPVGPPELAAESTSVTSRRLLLAGLTGRPLPRSQHHPQRPRVQRSAVRAAQAPEWLPLQGTRSRRRPPRRGCLGQHHRHYPQRCRQGRGLPTAGGFRPTRSQRDYSRRDCPRPTQLMAQRRDQQKARHRARHRLRWLVQRDSTWAWRNSRRYRPRCCRRHLRRWWGRPRPTREAPELLFVPSSQRRRPRRLRSRRGREVDLRARR